MNLSLWIRLGEWHQSMSESLQELLPATPGGLGPETIGVLRPKLMEGLEGLRAGLLQQISEREVNKFLLPLVLLLDEKILGRLRPADRRAWPLLQRELYGVESGGDLFYDLIDEQLEGATPNPWLCEVLLFCLSDGFRGRHGDAPVKVQAYRTKLITQLRQAEGQPEEETAPAEASEEKPVVAVQAEEPLTRLRRIAIYTATALVIITLPFVFVWLSNFYTVNG